MNAQTRASATQALQMSRSCEESERTVDITTIGRRTGLPRRIEMWFYRVEDGYYLTTQPSRRDWYANLLAHPRFTLHLKHDARIDLPAVATPVVDHDDRRRVLTEVVAVLRGHLDRRGGQAPPLPALDRWVEGSPLLRFEPE